MIRAVLFDFIGTTVKESDPEVINKCFERAFADNNVPLNISLLKTQRGGDKKTIIANILKSLELPVLLVHEIYCSLKKNIELNIHNFSENDGAREIFLYLREKNIRICLGSGLDFNVRNITQYVFLNHDNYFK